MTNHFVKINVSNNCVNVNCVPLICCLKVIYDVSCMYFVLSK